MDSWIQQLDDDDYKAFRTIFHFKIHHSLSIPITLIIDKFSTPLAGFEFRVFTDKEVILQEPYFWIAYLSATHLESLLEVLR